MSDLKYCVGCQDHFYNGNNGLGISECWSLKTARVVSRYKLAWWTRPTERGAFTKVKTHHCHRETGKFAFYKELPACAQANHDRNRSTMSSETAT